MDRELPRDLYLSYSTRSSCPELGFYSSRFPYRPVEQGEKGSHGGGVAGGGCRICVTRTRRKTGETGTRTCQRHRRRTVVLVEGRSPDWKEFGAVREKEESCV